MFIPRIVWDSMVELHYPICTFWAHLLLRIPAVRFRHPVRRNDNVFKKAEPDMDPSPGSGV